MDIAPPPGVRAPAFAAVRLSERRIPRRIPANVFQESMMSNRMSTMSARIAGVVSFCLAAAVCSQAGAAGNANTHNANNVGTTAAAKADNNGQVSSGDRKFMEEAAKGGMAEVKLGQLAAEKASSPEVKQFGQRMVDDHSKANDKLKQIAANKGVQLPTDVDKSAQREYDKLSKLSGAEFDREYMDHMVSDHKKDVSEFKKQASKAKDADLKQFASTTLPTLEQHLNMARSAEQVAKNEGKTQTSSRMSTRKTGS
jgi:putative membrane protein